jgi:arginine/lysine/ornithine decarboxylase
VSKNAPEEFTREARNALSLFGSTSPSYLILESLDLANKYISDGYEAKLNSFCGEIDKLKKSIIDFGYSLTSDEPLKITISAKSYGYTGDALAKEISERGGAVEFCDPDYVVLMLTPENENTEKIKALLCSIPRKDAISSYAPELPRPARAISPSEAIFAKSEALPIDECLGKILASVSVSCPPAVPVVVCGEIIDEMSIEIFKYYGINECRVVKK